MKRLNERTYARNRQTIMELYQKYYKDATAICRACYEDIDMANTTVVQAFENTWRYFFNNCTKSEEEFQITLYKQVAILCQKNYSEKEMKSVLVPQSPNFFALKWKDVCVIEEALMENLLAMLPGISRYIFVLHRIAGFDKKMIASITGYKVDVVEAAIATEEQYAVRTLEQRNIDARSPIELDKVIRQYRENMDLPEKYQKQIIDHIDVWIKSYEKKKIIRRSLYATCAVGLAIVVYIIGVSIGKKGTEVIFTTTEMEAGNVVQSGAVVQDNEQIDAERIGESSLDGNQSYYADIVIENFGTVTVRLDYKTAPITVENFITLAEEEFYDGLTFHRIMEGFMIQGGDPNGNGTGGSDKTIIGEFSDNGYENDLSHTRGAVSMARSRAYDSASSQFFIVHEDSTFLDGQYAAFGYVTEGMNIVDDICNKAKPTDNNGTIPEREQPVIISIDIRIENEK